MQFERQETTMRDQLHGLLRRAKMKARMDEDQKLKENFVKNVPSQVNEKLDVHPRKQILISWICNLAEIPDGQEHRVFALLTTFLEARESSSKHIV